MLTKPGSAWNEKCVDSCDAEKGSERQKQQMSKSKMRYIIQDNTYFWLSIPICNGKLEADRKKGNVSSPNKSAFLSSVLGLHHWICNKRRSIAERFQRGRPNKYKNSRAFGGWCKCFDLTIRRWASALTNHHNIRRFSVGQPCRVRKDKTFIQTTSIAIFRRKRTDCYAKIKTIVSYRTMDILWYCW